MKQTKQITVTEFICDSCGDVINHSPQPCIVCGKVKCANCSDFVSYAFNGPGHFGLSDWAEELPACHACPGCENEITREMKQIAEYVLEWKRENYQREEEYHRKSHRIFKLVEKREKEIEDAGQ